MSPALATYIVRLSFRHGLRQLFRTSYSPSGINAIRFGRTTLSLKLKYAPNLLPQASLNGAISARAMLVHRSETTRWVKIEAKLL
jgi:hypothetical protein